MGSELRAFVSRSTNSTSKIKKMVDAVMTDAELDHMDIDLGVQDYGNLISLGALSSMFFSPKFMTPAYNQLRVDSCVSYAVSGALGALVALDRPQQAYALDFSKQELVDCLPIEEGKGATFGECYDYVRRRGLHLEHDYPYQEGYFGCMCPQLRGRPKYTFRHIRLVYPKDVTEHLEQRPLTALITVYPSFQEFRSPGVSMIDLMGMYSPEPDEDPCLDSKGGPLSHAVLVVGYGYKNHELFYIIKNSWGVEWGVNGYACVRAHLLHTFRFPDSSRLMPNY